MYSRIIERLFKLQFLFLISGLLPALLLDYVGLFEVKKIIFHILSLLVILTIISKINKLIIGNNFILIYIVIAYYILSSVVNGFIEASITFFTVFYVPLIFLVYKKQILLEKRLLLIIYTFGIANILLALHQFILGPAGVWSFYFNKQFIFGYEWYEKLQIRVPSFSTVLIRPFGVYHAPSDFAAIFLAIYLASLDNLKLQSLKIVSIINILLSLTRNFMIGMFLGLFIKKEFKLKQIFKIFIIVIVSYLFTLEYQSIISLGSFIYRYTILWPELLSKFNLYNFFIGYGMGSAGSAMRDVGIMVHTDNGYIFSIYSFGLIGTIILFYFYYKLMPLKIFIVFLILNISGDIITYYAFTFIYLFLSRVEITEKTKKNINITVNEEHRGR